MSRANWYGAISLTKDMDEGPVELEVTGLVGSASPSDDWDVSVFHARDASGIQYELSDREQERAELALIEAAREDMSAGDDGDDE